MKFQVRQVHEEVIEQTQETRMLRMVSGKSGVSVVGEESLQGGSRRSVKFQEQRRETSRQETYDEEELLFSLGKAKRGEDDMLFSKEKMNRMEVSLFEKYFDDPEDLGVPGTEKLNRRLLQGCREGINPFDVDKLLAQGAQIDCQDEQGNTCLHLASRCGQIRLVRHLLMKTKANEETKNRHGKRPVDVAKDVNTRKVFFERHQHALFDCAAKDHLKMLQSLIAFMQREKMFDRQLPIMLLHVAAEHGSPMVVLYMLNVYRVPVDATTGVGRTALHYAAASNNYEIIRILLENGASTNVKDMRGKKPIEETNDRMTRRIIERVESLRSNQKDTKFLAKFKDYFGDSRVMVDQIFMVNFRIDPTRLQDVAGLAVGHPELVCVHNDPNLQGKDAEGTWSNYLVFCEEAMADAIYQSNVESAIHRRQMNMDYTFSTKGSFVLLKRNESNKKSSSSTARKGSSNHMGGGALFAALKQDLGQYEQVDDVDLDSDDDGDDENNAQNKTGGKGGSKMGDRSASFLQHPVINAFKNEEYKPMRKEDSFIIDRHQLNVSLFKPSFYTFIVTNAHGERTICSLICFLQTSPEGVVEGRCICLTARSPLFTMHRAILFDLFAVGMGYWNPEEKLSVNRMVASVVGKRSGLPGQQGVAIDLGTRYLTYTVPPNSALPVLDDICFQALLTCLSPENIVTVLSSILVEQPIALISDSLQLLSFVSQALVALLFPFEWCHPFIPVLPSRMLEIVEAPFPYVVGLHGSLFEVVSADRLGSLMLVNLDRDSVVVPIETKRFNNQSNDFVSVEVPTIPQVYQSALIAAIHESLPPKRFRAPRKFFVEQFCRPAHVEAYLESLDISRTTSALDASFDKLSPRRRQHSIVPALFGDPTASSTSSMMSQHDSADWGSFEEKSWKNLYKPCIKRLRDECVRMISRLIGPYGSSQFAPSKKSAFLEKQDMDQRPFLQALLNTQLWASFAKDFHDGATTQKREAELQMFATILDGEMHNPTLMVAAIRLYLYKSPSSNSEIIASIQRGDKVTVIDEIPGAVGERQVWLRFREYPGWCFANREEEFDQNLDKRKSSHQQLSSSSGTTLPTAQSAIAAKRRGHYHNELIYPPFPHDNEIELTYPELFHDLMFQSQFPKF